MATSTPLVSGTPGTETTYYGVTISNTMTVNGHVWTADSNGLFQTNADLKTEWTNYYDTMMAGHADTLTFIQRLEGNAEAVFENTGLKDLDGATLFRDREDAQREFDAAAAAEKQLGIDPKAAVTVQNYLAMTSLIANTPALLELGTQGHGLNNPTAPTYNGFTEDFQNNVDNTTQFIGGGLNNNQDAIANFFDDSILSHLPFPVVAQNGHLEQMNQNGDAEGTLSDELGAWDQYGSQVVLTSADFSATPSSTSSDTPVEAPNPSPSPAPAGYMYSLFGALVPTTLTVNGHTWTAGTNGLYEILDPATNKPVDLASEWKGYYTTLQNGGSLTAIQRLEANAEAVFENTGIAKSSAANLIRDRMDVQRELDAIAGVMGELGIGSAPLTQSQLLSIEDAFVNNSNNNPANPALEELGLQGHGLTGFSAQYGTRYNGFTNDFQNNTDNQTLYIGPGQNTGERAVANFFDDDILSHLVFPTVIQNGELIQLNQNGNAEETVQQQLTGLNQEMFTQVLTSADFHIPGTPAPGTTQAPGTTTTVFGDVVSTTVTNPVDGTTVLNGHTWTVGTDGRFDTTTDLKTEWKGYYATMLAGNGASLTAVQRAEGNAEAIFENTALSSNTARFNANQQTYREDAQREFDAIAVAMSALGLGGVGSAPLTEADYLNIAAYVQNHTQLEDLALQGHGLNNGPSYEFQGFTTDFQNNSDNTTLYIGPGDQYGQRAIQNVFDDEVITHFPFPVTYQNGTVIQLNQNANTESSLSDAVLEMNEAWYYYVYQAADFYHPTTTSTTTSTPTGPVDYVSPAMATASMMPTATGAATPGPNQMLNPLGVVVDDTVIANGDTWVAGANGLYELNANPTTQGVNLATQWLQDYQTALKGGTLTTVQHWIAQAEAVFENTGVNSQSPAQQAADRADVQRLIDAVSQVMKNLGLMNAQGNIAGALTDDQYRQIVKALQNNPDLEELAIQGFGLNNPGAYNPGSPEYNGFINDFSNANNANLYVGPGGETGERALSDFFADDVMSDLAFPVVIQNGEIKVEDQNGNTNGTLENAVEGLNATLFGPLYGAADFMTPGYQPPPPPVTPPASVTTLYGDTISGTEIENGHTWTADASGKFHTSANLADEWLASYNAMTSGGPLSVTQRLEANAEAVFLNSNLDTQQIGAAKLEADREDVQREIDAIASAMQTDQTLYGTNPNAPLTEATYLQLANTIQADPVLQELTLQGHGVPNTSSAVYCGAVGDFGTLLSSGTFNGLITNLAFPTVYQNGQWMQLDMNGKATQTVIQAATALNQALGQAAGPVAPISSITAPTGKEVTLSGQLISTTLSSVTEVENGQTLTANLAHTWTADANGLYHTANLAAEWQADFSALQAGGTAAANLTAEQRQEANAQEVFIATGLNNLSATAQQQYREDVQRQLDADAAAASITAQALNITPAAALLPGSYIPLERTLHNNAALEELAVQGFGVTGAGVGSRYSGYVNGFSGASAVRYVGGGVNNNTNALGTFMAENIMGYTASSVMWQNGKLVQLQGGQVADTVANADLALTQMQSKVLKSTNFLGRALARPAA